MSVHPHRRTHNTRIIKRDASYAVEEVAELLGVHINTVRLWRGNGLRPIDDRRPTLIHGSDLIKFLKKKQTKRRCTCAPEEFYCFRCRAPRRALNCQVTIEPQSEHLVSLTALCEVCGTKIFKAGSLRRRAHYEEIFAIQPGQAAHIIVCDQPLGNCDLETENSA